MYEDFYRLSGSPFRLTPDNKFYFHSEGHRKAMSYLKYGLYQGEGFIVISGEVGLGKSTLVGQLLQELNPNEVLAVQIGSTQVDGDDAIRLICQEIDIATENRSKAELLYGLERFLRKQVENSRRVLLVVDEAQNLPRRTLEELRMLSNLSTAGQPLLQGFLLGQPQFLETLARPDLSQLQQRVIASYQLQPMSKSETEEYVRHRLETVGWTGDNPVLTPGAFESVHLETEGVPRRINHLCNRILLFGALEQLTEVDHGVVDAVIDDMKGEAVSPLAKTERDGATGDAAASADRAAWAGAAAASGGDEGPVAKRLEQIEQQIQKHDAALHELISVAISQAESPGAAEPKERSERAGPARPNPFRRPRPAERPVEDLAEDLAEDPAEDPAEDLAEDLASHAFAADPETAPARPRNASAERWTEARPRVARPRDEPIRGEPARRDPMRGEPTRSEPTRSEPTRSPRPSVADPERVAAGAPRRPAAAHDPGRDAVRGAAAPPLDVSGPEVDPWTVDPWELEARAARQAGEGAEAARSDGDPAGPVSAWDHPTPPAADPAPRGSAFGRAYDRFAAARGGGVDRPGDPEIDPWAASRSDASDGDRPRRDDPYGDAPSSSGVRRLRR